MAPIQHGVNSYDTDGNLEWSYSGLANGYDVRHIVAADLQGTGYNDTIVVGAGFATTAGWNHVAILDKDGGEIQEIKLSGVSSVQSLAVDGTDIYLATNIGITKLVKSGSTWSEDTTNWSKSIGQARAVTIDDMGNGKRIYVITFGSTPNVRSYYPDGTQEWSAGTGNYNGIIQIGEVDNTNSGKEMMVAYQSALRIFNKDGGTLATITTGTNVRTGLTLYDSDSNGEEEIYFSDMGSDIYSFERTGVNTYTQKYSNLNNTSQAGLAHYDLDEDGEAEIIAGTNTGYILIYSADLSTLKKSINTGVSQYMGGQNWEALAINMYGLILEDLTGDGHTDMAISGSAGYLYAYESTGLISDSDPPTPDPSTFSTAPDDASATSIDMVATTATDADGADPVEYYFTYEPCDTHAGTGGTSSSWQTSTSYTDTGLQANQCYGYTVTARDSLGNTTATSSASEAYTAANTPGAPTLSNQSSSTIDIDNDANGNPAHTTYAVQIENTSPNDSTWEGKYVNADGDPSDAAVWLTDSQIDAITITGLNAGTYYEAKVKARNGDNEETSFSSADGVTTEENSDVYRPLVILGNVRLQGVRLH